MRKSKYTDGELMEQLNQGKHWAFRELYDRHWSRLFFYAFQITEDKMVSEDIVQEIFLELWDNRKNRTLNNPAAYLSGAVKLKSLNILRNKTISQNHLQLFHQVHSEENTEQTVILNETQSQIEAMLSTLPPKCKQIFKMSRYEQLTYEEISQNLHLSVQTVKNQISKALGLLRGKI